PERWAGDQDVYPGAGLEVRAGVDRQAGGAAHRGLQQPATDEAGTWETIAASAERGSRAKLRTRVRDGGCSTDVVARPGQRAEGLHAECRGAQPGADPAAAAGLREAARVRGAGGGVVSRRIRPSAALSACPAAPGSRAAQLAAFCDECGRSQSVHPRGRVTPRSNDKLRVIQRAASPAGGKVDKEASIHGRSR